MGMSEVTNKLSVAVSDGDKLEDVQGLLKIEEEDATTLFLYLEYYPEEGEKSGRKYLSIQIDGYYLRNYLKLNGINLEVDEN